MYTIKFPNGDVIEAIGINGTYYIVPEKVDVSRYDEVISEIVITSDDRGTQTANNTKIIQMEMEGEHLLGFVELTQQELINREADDNITDIQMALSDLYESEDTDLTDVQMALAEIYELLS